ncbi:hypothetical protein JXB02_02130 [Candidatus Woesearchaeota archaeon]|nr:hypothetical protein [Candidatus Woesearchaeota archaeon]
MNRLVFGIIITLMLAATALSAFSASEIPSCAADNGCYNQDGRPYCGFNDQTCAYHWYEFDGACTHDTDSFNPDADADGWTDYCDAFPDDSDEQVDLDADGCGHEADLDDFNPAETAGCPAEEPQAPGDSGNDDDDDTPVAPVRRRYSSGSSGSMGTPTCNGMWTCADGGCVCVAEESTEEESAQDSGSAPEPLPTTVSVTIEDEPEEETEEQDDKGDTLVTGAVIAGTPREPLFPWWILFLVLAAVHFTVKRAYIDPKKAPAKAGFLDRVSNFLF